MTRGDYFLRLSVKQGKGGAYIYSKVLIKSTSIKNVNNAIYFIGSIRVDIWTSHDKSTIANGTIDKLYKVYLF